MYKKLLIVAYLLFLLLSITGCSKKKTHRILVVHSYEYSYSAYPDFNRLIKDDFEKLGIDPDIKVLYLDCESYQEQPELNQMRELLGSLKGWKPEVILVNEDQATYSLLKCGHPLVEQVPIVFSGVNYPNWEQIKKHPNVTGFHDKIDFKTNFQAAKELFGEKVFPFVILDKTFVDRAILSDLKELLKNEKITGNIHSDYSWAKRDSLVKKEGYMNLGILPARRINSYGGALIWTLSKYTPNGCYMQLKRDYTTVNMGNVSASPSMTVINEAFGYGEKLLGGYITPLTTQVNESVRAAVRILRGALPADIPICESKKEFMIDWLVLKQMKWDEERIPEKYHYINMPFKEQYRGTWIFLIVLISIILLGIFSMLVFLYLREQGRKKRALYALADEKETLALSIEGGNTYAWKLQDELIVLENAFWKSIGEEPRKLTVEELESYVHPQQRNQFELNRQNLSLAKKKIAQLKCDFDGQGYQWWEFRYTTSPLTSGQNRTAGLLLNIQSIKDREQELDSARCLAEKAELKQSFLANMSHEIRTPLNAIVGFSNILAMDEELEESDRIEYIDTINRNSELLLKLINDILELSRIESGNMTFLNKTCQVSELVNKVYMTHKVLIPAQLDFIEEVDDTPMEIEVDRDRLTQVLTNFLNNASKFTKTGYIKLGYCYVPQENRVRIYVEDTGMGIPKEEQRIIFSRFYKQNEFAQGTGLGLSICQLIVEKSGGNIELWSEPSKGSRFTVVLPCRVIS